MRWISRLEFLSIFVSIDFVLRKFRFSDDFRFRMVFPLVALFFGTGNQTPSVSAAIVARVFRDKSMAIFKYHEELLLDEVIECDELIMACPANVALSLLRDPSRAERSVLSSVDYFRDLSVTHTDDAYMRKHNEVDGKAIYFIKTLDEKPKCIEMGFDLSGYQPELQQVPELQAAGERIYQTIYLDERARDDWTIAEIDPTKVIDKAWWCAFSHTYKHFRRVVPWVWRLQRPGRTLYAGSWTLFNTHDIAIASGFAAAARIGAPYPFPENALAAATFHTVLMASHLRRKGPKAP